MTSLPCQTEDKYFQAKRSTGNIFSHDTVESSISEISVCDNGVASPPETFQRSLSSGAFASAEPSMSTVALVSTEAEVSTSESIAEERNKPSSSSETDIQWMFSETEDEHVLTETMKECSFAIHETLKSEDKASFLLQYFRCNELYLASGCFGGDDYDDITLATSQSSTVHSLSPMDVLTVKKRKEGNQSYESAGVVEIVYINSKGSKSDVFARSHSNGSPSISEDKLLSVSEEGYNFEGTNTEEIVYISGKGKSDTFARSRSNGSRFISRNGLLSVSGEGHNYETKDTEGTGFIKGGGTKSDAFVRSRSNGSRLISEDELISVLEKQGNSKSEGDVGSSYKKNAKSHSKEDISQTGEYPFEFPFHDDLFLSDNQEDVSKSVDASDIVRSNVKSSESGFFLKSRSEEYKELKKTSQRSCNDMMLFDSEEWDEASDTSTVLQDENINPNGTPPEVISQNDRYDSVVNALEDDLNNDDAIEGDSASYYQPNQLKQKIEEQFISQKLKNEMKPNSSKDRIFDNKGEEVAMIDFRMGDAELYKAIDGGMWKRALSILQRSPNEAKIWVYKKSKRNSAIKWMFLPIHVACFSGAPYKLVKGLILAYPDSLKMHSFFGSLPLHIASESFAQSGVISLIYRMYPDALYARDDDGYTPIQNAKYSEDANRRDQGRVIRLLTKFSTKRH